MSLAINGLSHIASPSLAEDLAPDLVAKLNHTSPHVRKKAVPVLYKCFLQSPELLRTSWPRLRECLNDEDNSVVSATVNVICELARRNPKNYLPLAPQLFKLLTDGGNNWMTIKIIKLFATLTPLEPRLIKKLVPPITNLIQTTPAMSLLYECISGLISGGLLAGMQDTYEGEELASVCVTKLRGFLVEGDSNLKYVGLIALTRLVKTHAHLVSAHHDVVLDCLDDEDISIRYRALELVVGMINSESLSAIVGKLMRQLKSTNIKTLVELEGAEENISDDEDAMKEEVMHPRRAQKGEIVALELPEEYKFTIIAKILEMCSRDMYTNVTDFEWYLDVLVQLVRYAPAVRKTADMDVEDDEDEEIEDIIKKRDVGEEIGRELRNVAVRVKSIRSEAVRSAEILIKGSDGVFPAAGGGGRRVLGAAGWIVGEYASLLAGPNTTFDSLLNSSSYLLPSDILAVYIQAVVKIYATLVGSESVAWTSERKSTVSLLTEQVIRFLEPLATSPNLEVQERAVEFLELFRLVGEAITAQPVTSESSDEQYDPPLLLTQAVPSLFSEYELNPVAPRAQRKVPLPPNLDLDEPINPRLHHILAAADYDVSLTGDDDAEDEEFRKYYYERNTSASTPTQNQPAAFGIDSAAARSTITSYQGMSEEDYLDADILARRRQERRERNRDDPFYIFAPGETEGVTDVDLESIPVMELKLEDLPSPTTSLHQPIQRQTRQQIQIAIDEGIEGIDDDGEDNGAVIENSTARRKKKKPGLLYIDSSNLIGYSLDEEKEGKRNDAEVEEAKLEVQRLRREMELAAERVKVRQSQEKPAIPSTVTTKKKKPKPNVTDDGTVKDTKKKKSKLNKKVEGVEGEGVVKKKKKKSKEKKGMRKSEEVDGVTVS